MINFTTVMSIKIEKIIAVILKNVQSLFSDFEINVFLIRNIIPTIITNAFKRVNRV